MRAIQGPAQRAGLRLEPGLTEAFSDEAGDEPGALRLVAARPHGDLVAPAWHAADIRRFRAAGGVVGAISQSAEHAYERLDDDERRVTLDACSSGS